MRTRTYFVSYMYIFESSRPPGICYLVRNYTKNIPLVYSILRNFSLFAFTIAFGAPCEQTFGFAANQDAILRSRQELDRGTIFRKIDEKMIETREKFEAWKENHTGTGSLSCGEICRMVFCFLFVRVRVLRKS